MMRNASSVIANMLPVSVSTFRNCFMSRYLRSGALLPAPAGRDRLPVWRSAGRALHLLCLGRGHPGRALGRAVALHGVLLLGHADRALGVPCQELPDHGDVGLEH